ncbi:MAG: hypothetical protein ACD_15C00111G0002 [uncultured bacterium]|nr:MAG: hypothetical protein ACD_15C00111G0002 [uncultured bacterium]HCU71065.1 hypothetical protein [Candidatus Moranbacteria bacterium]
MAKKGLIIFGCDGVLIPFSWEKLFEAFQSISLEFGINFLHICPDMQRFKTWFSHDMQNNIDRIRMKNREITYKMNNALHVIYGHESEVFDWVPDIVDKLSQAYDLAVLSSSRITDSVVVSLGKTAKKFNAIVGCDMIGKNRSDPDGLSAIMRQFNVSAINTVFIGHTISDIYIAKKYRLSTAAVAWGATSRPVDIIAMRADRNLTHPSQIFLFGADYIL